MQYGKLIYICNPITKGRVAQLVQSTWFTPRGSGVRIPSRPHPRNPSNIGVFALYTVTSTNLHLLLFCLITTFNGIIHAPFMQELGRSILRWIREKAERLLKDFQLLWLSGTIMSQKFLVWADFSKPWKLVKYI